MKKALTDPIADLLTRIRNALAVGQTTTQVPHSKLKEQILELLKQRELIDSYSKKSDGLPVLEITLNSNQTNSPINGLQRVSKPGRRVYAKAGAIPSVMRGRGLMVVSTSKGLMSDSEARKQHLGGELICKVW